MNLVDKLKELVKEWKEEAGFLNGPEDSVEDQYAGLAYGECAAQLTKLVQGMEEQEQTKPTMEVIEEIKRMDKTEFTAFLKENENGLFADAFKAGVEWGQENPYSDNVDEACRQVQGVDMVLEKKELGNPLWFGWYTDNPFGLSK